MAVFGDLGVLVSLTVGTADILEALYRCPDTYIGFNPQFIHQQGGKMEAVIVQIDFSVFSQ